MKKCIQIVIAMLLATVAYAAEPQVKIYGPEGGSAALKLYGDQGDDAADIVFLSVADGGTLSIMGTSGTNPIVTIDQSGNAAIDGVLTPAGGLGGTTLAVTNDATVAGTLGVTGVATFIGNALANELDSRTATALLIGKATATSVVIGAADVVTTIGAGGFCAPVRQALTDGTTTRVMTSADYGKLITVTNGAAIAITLPANGAAAGSWVDIAIGAQAGGGADACAPTISAATVDTLVGPNDVDLDSVTWGTGHRIGAYARFWSDGGFWHVLNLGGTTMTYTD